MAQYTFNGFYTTVYTGTLDANGNVLVASPGETYTLDTAPDALWVSVSTAKTAPEAPAEPVTPEPTPTPTQSESEPQ